MMYFSEFREKFCCHHENEHVFGGITSDNLSLGHKKHIGVSIWVPDN